MTDSESFEILNIIDKNENIEEDAKYPLTIISNTILQKHNKIQELHYKNEIILKNKLENTKIDNREEIENELYQNNLKIKVLKEDIDNLQKKKSNMIKNNNKKVHIIRKKLNQVNK